MDRSRIYVVNGLGIFGPYLADLATCVAHNLDLWLERVSVHVNQGADEEILQSLSVVCRAVAY